MSTQKIAADFRPQVLRKNAPGNLFRAAAQSDKIFVGAEKFVEINENATDEKLSEFSTGFFNSLSKTRLYIPLFIHNLVKKTPIFQENTAFSVQKPVGTVENSNEYFLLKTAFLSS